MDLKKLAYRVIQMRNAQKEYYKTRNKVFLSESIRLEHEVDKMLDAIMREENEPSLNFE